MRGNLTYMSVGYGDNRAVNMREEEKDSRGDVHILAPTRSLSMGSHRIVALPSV